MASLQEAAIDSGPLPRIQAPWAGCGTFWDLPWDRPWTVWVVHQCYVCHSVNFSYSVRFDILSSCYMPGPRNCAVKRKVSVPMILQRLSTLVLGIISCHLVLAIPFEHLRWNWSHFSCITSLQSPWLVAIQQSCERDCSVDSDLVEHQTPWSCHKHL